MREERNRRRFSVAQRTSANQIGKRRQTRNLILIAMKSCPTRLLDRTWNETAIDFERKWVSRVSPKEHITERARISISIIVYTAKGLQTCDSHSIEHWEKCHERDSNSKGWLHLHHRKVSVMVLQLFLLSFQFLLLLFTDCFRHNLFFLLHCHSMTINWAK